MKETLLGIDKSDGTSSARTRRLGEVDSRAFVDSSCTSTAAMAKKSIGGNETMVFVVDDFSLCQKNELCN